VIAHYLYGSRHGTCEDLKEGGNAPQELKFPIFANPTDATNIDALDDPMKVDEEVYCLVHERIMHPPVGDQFRIGVYLYKGYM